MKKTLVLTGILVLALGAYGMATAGGQCDKTAAAASGCTKSAEAKAASRSTMRMNADRFCMIRDRNSGTEPVSDRLDDHLA